MMGGGRSIRCTPPASPPFPCFTLGVCACMFALLFLATDYGSSPACSPPPQVLEDIEYLKFDKAPWTEQDDVTFHYLRVL